MDARELRRAEWRKTRHGGQNGAYAEVSVWRKSTYTGQNGACVEVSVWRKSSYSGQNGSCVEVAAWVKSTHSGQNGSCVEVARNLPDAVAVRDSKDPDGPKLAFAPAQWHRFASRIKAGRLDLT